MRLSNLGSNKTTVTFDNGVQVFFSYETPVAARLQNYEYVRTSTKWSKTTTKHINQWLEGVTAQEVEQDFLNKLIDA